MPAVPQKSKPAVKSALVTKPNPGRPNRLRAFGAFVFGLLFLFFASTAILAYWTERTLTDTDNFSQAVGPIASEEAVKAFISREITSTVLEKSSQAELANGLLGLPPGTQITPQVSAQLEQKISSSVDKILSSKAFDNLWSDGTKQVHAQLIHVLSAEDDGAVATINVRPQLETLIKLVQDSELKLGDEVKLEADSGQIKITSDKLANARTVYRHFTKVDTLALVLALISAGLAVLIANRRLKTVRKLAFALGIGCALSAVIIFIVTHVSLAPSDQLQSDFIRSVLSGTLSGLLKLYLYILALAALVTILATLMLRKNWLKGLKK